MATTPSTVMTAQDAPVNAPIGVFDSGVGGLTVLREVVRARAGAHYVYVADDAFFPYGHHTVSYTHLTLPTICSV